MALDGLLGDEGAHAENLDTVRIPEVVAQVKLVQVQRHHELGEVWRQVRRAHQRNVETWSAAVSIRGRFRGKGVGGVGGGQTGIFFSFRLLALLLAAVGWCDEIFARERKSRVTLGGRSPVSTRCRNKSPKLHSQSPRTRCPPTKRQEKKRKDSVIQHIALDRPF